MGFHVSAKSCSWSSAQSRTRMSRIFFDGLCFAFTNGWIRAMRPELDGSLVVTHLTNPLCWVLLGLKGCSVMAAALRGGDKDSVWPVSSTTPVNSSKAPRR